MVLYIIWITYSLFNTARRCSLMDRNIISLQRVTLNIVCRHFVIRPNLRNLCSSDVFSYGLPYKGGIYYAVRRLTITFQDIKGLLTEREVCTVKYRTEVFKYGASERSERGPYLKKPRSDISRYRPN